MLQQLTQLLVTPTIELSTKQNGDYVNVAGLVLVRQRPGTAAGICFITIEDETGFANCVMFPGTFELFRKPILQARLLMLQTRLQVEEKVIHVIVERCIDLNGLLRTLTVMQGELPPVSTPSRSDEKSIPTTELDKRNPGPKWYRLKYSPVAGILNDHSLALYATLTVKHFCV